MSIPAVDEQYLFDSLVALLNTPSPTGLAEPAVALAEEKLRAFSELHLHRTRKGGLVAHWPGKSHDLPRALTAHVDTLGAVVKEIKDNGRLKLSKIGSFAWNTVEGEGCTIFRSSHPLEPGLRGSFLVETASAHIYGAQVGETKRDDESMEVRLDAFTTTSAETRALGVAVGDFVSFDPRVEVNQGFIRSRHLDDKACVACVLAAVKALHDAGLQPARDTTVFVSNFEEVGHGAAAGIPPETAELLVVDMAAVGEGQKSDEFHVSLCVKDSHGPYHHAFSQSLRRIAEGNQIPYRTDVYVRYNSDGLATLRSGADLAVGLIGPGVDASHSYERTHREALLATTQWLCAYLLAE